jgi:hypothetical protein
VTLGDGALGALGAAVDTAAGLLDGAGVDPQPAMRRPRIRTAPGRRNIREPYLQPEEGAMTRE